MPRTDADRKWQERAKALLRSELIRRQMTTRDLAERLGEMGAGNVRVLENRIARGAFDAGFFIQCLDALGVKTLHLDDHA